MRENELFRDVIIPDSAGAPVRLDGTPMRLYRSGIRAESSEIVCRMLTSDKCLSQFFSHAKYVCADTGL